MRDSTIGSSSLNRGNRQEVIMSDSPHVNWFTFARLAAAALLLAVAALAGETVTFNYDANGRLLKADYGGGKVATYTYDKSGNILAAVSESPDNTLRVAVSPGNAGHVTGPDIACPATCVHAFAGTRSVTLSGVPAVEYKLLAWAGGLVSAANPFTFTLDADRNLTAYFGAATGSTDSDGIPDTSEMGPSGTDPSYDGNGDGIPDYQQENVASLPTAAGGGYATIEVPAGQALVSVQAVANPHPDDAPAARFPYGFFAFTVTGVPASGVVVTLYLPPNQAIADYYKYGPTPDNPVAHWYQFGLSGSTGAAVVQTATTTRVLLHFVDAQRGDDVLTTDSLIIDAGGPTVRAAPSIRSDPSSLEFGPVPAGGHLSRTITVENVGDADLVIGTIGQGDSLTAPFSIAGDTCSGLTLRPQPTGGSCQITVSFAPTGSGTFADTFAIPSNDTVRNPVTVPAHGQGTNVEPIPTLDIVGLALLIAVLLLLGAAALRRTA
ncbi:MAG TPA: choice-of-anchor D domain-containing protein [Thermoanaerobaculaceae bacterium]|nr:choice-of-anchor D domain-containing protein [Thermoanaerobaculaceae bacterium]